MCCTVSGASFFFSFAPGSPDSRVCKRRMMCIDIVQPWLGTAVSIEELQTIRASQGIGNTAHRTQVNHCTVYYECRRSDAPKHVDQMLGTGVIFFPETNTMLGTSSSTNSR